jgi:hypothetical protein
VLQREERKKEYVDKTEPIIVTISGNGFVVNQSTAHSIWDS